MKHLLLVTCLGFAVGFGASSCGNSGQASSCNSTNCEGCCDNSNVCRKGDAASACGAAGVVCNLCSGGQVCGPTQACVVPTNDAGTDGGIDAGLDAGTMDAGTPRCGSTAVSCSDQVSLSLDLKSTVNAAVLTNVADGLGFKSAIDATAGSTGFSSPTQSYVYAKFTSTGLQKVAISDDAALSSLDWDIAFRRFVIRLNGGSSGPSCVGAVITAIGTGYDTLTAVPSGSVFATDDFVGPPASCTFKDDGSGLGTSPSTALSNYYRYTNCVSMTGRVFVVQTRLGRNVKLVVTTYYATEAAQMNCDTGAAPGAPGATVRVRWSFLD